MNALLVVIHLSLASIVLATEWCPPTPAPRYPCNENPRDGTFFPHPRDCTFLVVCVGVQDIAVSVCDEERYRHYHRQTCPEKCPEFANSSTPVGEITTPGVTTSIGATSEGVTTTEGATIEGATIEGATIEGATIESLTTVTSTESSFGESSGTETTTETSSTTAATEATTTIPLDITCKRSGILDHPFDCTKAFVCASSGTKAMEISVCADANLEAKFPVGCLLECPRWRGKA